MRKAFVIAWLALGLSVGCSTNGGFVQAVDGYAQVVLPEYRRYVQADPKLDEDSRRIRLQTADRFQQLIEEAKRGN
ncbi:MAG: hypothetical protein HYY16_16435 [Planctomycetes bacterium]|nr:hypothetical protein [Planctomycetota bacterium]